MNSPIEREGQQVLRRIQQTAQQSQPKCSIVNGGRRIAIDVPPPPMESAQVRKNICSDVPPPPISDNTSCEFKQDAQRSRVHNRALEENASLPPPVTPPQNQVQPWMTMMSQPVMRPDAQRRF
ncbi:MAG: hypothetical protein K2Z81_25600 [Cyanobacteria bacterium]|nr:hypothetical protein [Cyanobacteriota bacterium]